MNRFDNLVVCLDNGHASSTAGKKSPYSTCGVLPELPFEEWEFNRDIVARIKAGLEEQGIEVFVVVPEEISDVMLSTRAQRANDYVKESKKKGIFISIHADAAGNGTEWKNARGWAAWTTVGQNNSDKLADCLYNAAERIIPEYKEQYGVKIRTDKQDGDRDYESNFTVIYKANMPAVLTENFFYDNIDDLTFMLTEEGKNAIAQIHIDGIIAFAKDFYKM